LEVEVESAGRREGGRPPISEEWLLPLLNMAAEISSFSDEAAIERCWMGEVRGER
jgi:hypothetical protein